MSSLLKAKGFTLIELLVTLSIFFIMTALLVSKYGQFNNSVFLTNLAYDVAVTIRTAQTYGLSVQGGKSGSDATKVVYNYPYGVAFCKVEACMGNDTFPTFGNQEFILFADTNKDIGDLNGAFDVTDIVVNRYAIQNGYKISDICSYNTFTANYECGLSRADITFRRPDPDAVICLSEYTEPNACVTSVGSTLNAAPRAKIVIQAPDQKTKTIFVNRIGQISVENN